MSDFNEVPDSVANRPQSDVRITGKTPAALKAALKAVREQRGVKDADGEIDNKKSGMKFAAAKELPISQGRMTGSAQLEDVIRLLEPKDSNLYDEILLPSLGKFYNGKDGPKDGIVHIRGMTGSEELILATPKYVKKGYALDMIYQQCLQEPYPTQEFLSIDRTYLLIWLRGMSYTSKYEVEIRCPDTDNKFTTELDLSELIVNYCPDDFGPDNLQGILPKSGLKFEYRLSRGEDEKAVQDYRESNIKKWGDSGTDDTLAFRTATLLTSIEGLTDKFELKILLQKLPVQDVNFLRNLISEPPFGVETKLNVLSPYTTNEFTVDLPMEANFFFPRTRKKKE